jgi:hypothetical protein
MTGSCAEPKHTLPRELKKERKSNGANSDNYKRMETQLQQKEKYVQKLGTVYGVSSGLDFFGNQLQLEL